MLFISINKAAPEMILGKTIFSHDGRVLLHAGVKLTQPYIDKLKFYGYGGIYIDDEFSQEVSVQDIISDDLRQTAVNKVKRIFIDIQKDSSKTASNTYAQVIEMRKIVSDIIDQIVDSKGTIINIIDLKNYDEYTFQHSVNVAVVSLVLGLAGGLNMNELFNLGIAAIFHDIGKVKIPNKILNKPDKLTDDEFEIIKEHSLFSYEFLKKRFDLPTTVFVSVLQHHEKFNGAGYPYSTAGEDISQFARIIAVADVYDAITSIRPYRKPMLPSDAFEYIMANSSVHFDPEVVKIFVTKVAPYPLGTTVKLSNNQTGIVVRNYEDCLMRPKIKLFPDGRENTKEVRYLDLKNDPNTTNITIIEAII